MASRTLSGTCIVLLISMMIVNIKAGILRNNVEEILAVASRAEQAYNTGDLDTLVSLYTEDCRILFPQRPEQRGQEGQPADIASYNPWPVKTVLQEMCKSCRYFSCKTCKILN